jgi:hypothetical protein
MILGLVPGYTILKCSTLNIWYATSLEFLSIRLLWSQILPQHQFFITFVPSSFARNSRHNSICECTVLWLVCQPMNVPYINYEQISSPITALQWKEHVHARNRVTFQWLFIMPLWSHHSILVCNCDHISLMERDVVILLEREPDHGMRFSLEPEPTLCLQMQFRFSL